MEYEFGDKKLIELYTTGQSRKLKLPPGVAQAFAERVQRIEAAVTIDDLRFPPSMVFEKLHGYQNRFSIRLNRQYRLEFEIAFTDEARTTGRVRVVGISKHYE